MDKLEFQRAIGVRDDGIIGTKSAQAFEALLSNRKAAAITNADIDAAAKALNVSAAHIRAIRKVESGPQGSFDDKGRPTILFERHKFHDFTKGVFSSRFPNISNRSAGGYGKYSQQWDRLLLALRLDPDAAIKSCSWGLFQVMGFHWKILGYASALDMARRMASSEGAQLDAMVRYIRVFGLDDELRACRAGDPKSCRAFAKGYNGPRYADNNYHAKIAGAIA